MRFNDLRLHPSDKIQVGENSAIGVVMMYGKFIISIKMFMSFNKLFLRLTIRASDKYI